MHLTPSQRTHLIIEIGRRLGTEEWSVIDLTLRQFELPWTDNWRGAGPPTYVIEMIAEAPDDKLVALSEHLGYEFRSSREVQVEPSFWATGFLRLFVSHLAEFRQFAGEVQEQLLAFGISAFVAHNDIKATLEWQDEIELALATCDAMLVLLHPGFHESNWADQEIGYAMGRRVMIVAVRLGTDPYGFIGRFQALEGQQKGPAELARGVLEVLVRHRMTRERISRAVVECFAKSESFSDAKMNMGLLEELSYWDVSLSKRVDSAMEENSQIKDAFGVPRRLQQLIARMDEK